MTERDETGERPADDETSAGTPPPVDPPPEHELRGEIDEILRQDDEDSVEERFFPRMYGPLRRLAAFYLHREPPGHSWQTSDLVHELFLRWKNSSSKPEEDEPAFLAAASHAFRLMLIDHWRSKNRQRRGGGWSRLSLSEGVTLAGVHHDVDLLDLSQATERLAERYPRASQIVELHFFAGMTLKEAAGMLGFSHKVAKDDWTLAKAFLRRELGRQ